MQVDAWRDRLEEAESAWACPDELADATLGARLHFLQGIAHASAGDEAKAADAFRTALRSDPELAWDPDFAPDARPIFDRVRNEDPPKALTLTLIPTDQPAALRIDGRTSKLEAGTTTIPAGLHLVQLEGSPPLWAQFEQDAWLVVPAGVRSTRLDVQSASGRAAFDALAEGYDLPRLLVPTAKQTFERTPEGWTPHRPPLGRRVALPLMVTGAVVAAAGAGWMAVESTAGQQRVDQVGPDLDTASYDALGKAHRAGRARWTGAAGLVAAGGLVAGAGVTLRVVAW